MEKREKNPWFILVVCITPILILCVTIAVVCIKHSPQVESSSEFDRRIKELSKAGFPVSLDDLEERYVLPEGAENAADLYIQAFNAYVEPTEEERQFLPIRGRFRRKDNSSLLPPEVFNTIESSLQSNRKTLELIDKAAKMQHCMFPRSRHTYHFMIDDFNKIKNFAQLLYERNLYLSCKGQTDLLFESLKTTFTYAHCCLEQPFLFDYMFMAALEGMAVNSLEESLNFAEFTNKQLHALFNKVRDTRRSSMLTPALINERVYMIEYLRLPANEQIDISPNSFTAIGENDAAQIFDYYDDMIKSTKLPPSEHLMRTDEIFNNLDHMSETQFSIASGLDRQIMEIGARVTGQLICAETALAIERYRLKHRNYPRLLEQLVPAFLDKIPIEPFDGKPIRYRQLGNTGYTLYAIGKDRKDNNGLSKIQLAETNDGKSPQEFDWPFTVNRLKKP